MVLDGAVVLKAIVITGHTGNWHNDIVEMVTVRGEEPLADVSSVSVCRYILGSAHRS
jgi:hypothetical protein